MNKTLFFKIQGNAMPKKQRVFNVEVSDIYEPEQEDFVIEKVKGYIQKDYETLKEYFKSTDTIEVKRLSEEDAKSLSSQLKSIDVTVNIYNVQEKKVEEEKPLVKCPKCGYKLEYPDWRCPECYYEFPDYDFQGDEEEEEDKTPDNNEKQES